MYLSTYNLFAYPSVPIGVHFVYTHACHYYVTPNIMYLSTCNLFAYYSFEINYAHFICAHTCYYYVTTPLYIFLHTIRIVIASQANTHCAPSHAYATFCLLLTAKKNSRISMPNDFRKRPTLTLTLRYNTWPLTRKPRQIPQTAYNSSTRHSLHTLLCLLMCK